MELENSPLNPAEQAIVAEETKLLVQTQSALTLQALPQQQKNYHDDIIELRNSISEVHTEDLPAILAHMERLVLLAQQQQKTTIELPVNRLNPYFAHICLKEENRKRHVLIGNNHCTLDGLPHPIIDWKNAPLSRIYYRYQEGDEYEEEFEKRSMAGILLVRRTLSLEQGLLQRIDTGSLSLIHTEQGWRRMSATSSHLQGGSGAATRPLHLAKKVETAGLGSRVYRKDKFLQEITALIDPAQFEVITQPEAGIVAIQGGAGSGKTTVALHRLAYLTALKPHYFIPSRLLTIVFNKALSTYISKVLPALGVDSVQSWVYQNWTAAFRQRFFPNLPNRYSDRTPVAVIEIKRHPVMLHWMKNQVQAHAERFYQQLQRHLSPIPEKQRAFDAWEALRSQPLARRLLLLRHWCEDRESIPRVRACQSFILQTRIQKLIDDCYPALCKSLNSLAILIWEEAFLDQDQLEKTFHEHAPNTFTAGQFKEVREWAVQNFEQRHLIGNEQGNLQENEPTVQQLDEEDDTLLLLLYQMTVGPFRGKKKKQIQYPHILVDEAQDFSPVELQLLLETTPQNRPSVTLAGDFDQQIMVGSPAANWSEMFQHLGLEETAVSTLKIGYRSTHEIIEIAKAVMGPSSVNQEWNAVRHGGAVELFKFQNHGHLINFLAEALIEVSVREPAASIAILTRYNAQADLIHTGLVNADVPQLRRVRDQEFLFAPGIEISEIAQVKGLEFDYVVLIDVDEPTFPKDAKARHLLYVGVTRAAHQLWVMTCREPSPLLPLHLLEAGN